MKPTKPTIITKFIECIPWVVSVILVMVLFGLEAWEL